jgi:transcriptional regulator with XRE-family HTH domain
VSAEAQVSLGYLSEIERGRKEASSELLGAICSALDTSLSEVLFSVATDVAGAERGPIEIIRAA